MLYMKVRLKLIATYRQFLPAEAKGNTITLDVSPGTSIADILNNYNIPLDEASVILVNGTTQSPEYVLKEGDTLTAFPAMAGGT